MIPTSTALTVARMSAQIVGSLCFSGAALAIGLGDLEVRSYLGEPLNLRIALNAGADEPLDASCFSIATPSAPDNSAAPGTSSSVPKITRRDASITLVETNRGRYLQVRGLAGQTGFNEPLAKLSVRAGCQAEAGITRDYAVLLDPPSRNTLSAVPSISNIDATSSETESTTKPAGDVTNTSSANTPTNLKSGKSGRASDRVTVSNALPAPRQKIREAAPAAPTATSTPSANPTNKKAISKTAPASATNNKTPAGGFQLRLSGSEADLSRSQGVTEEVRAQLREKMLLLDSDDQVAQLLSLKNTVKQLEVRLNEMQSRMPSVGTAIEAATAANALPAQPLPPIAAPKTTAETTPAETAAASATPKETPPASSTSTKLGTKSVGWLDSVVFGIPIRWIASFLLALVGLLMLYVAARSLYRRSLEKRLGSALPDSGQSAQSSNTATIESAKPDEFSDWENDASANPNGKASSALDSSREYSGNAASPSPPDDKHSEQFDAHARAHADAIAARDDALLRAIREQRTAQLTPDGESAYALSMASPIAPSSTRSAPLNAAKTDFAATAQLDAPAGLIDQQHELQHDQQLDLQLRPRQPQPQSQSQSQPQESAHFSTTTVDFLLDGDDDTANADHVRRLQYMSERYPELAAKTISIDDPDSVINAARLYYVETHDAVARDKACELLSFAIEERPQQISYWLAQFEIYRLGNLTKDFTELASKFHVLFGHTEHWPKVRHIGHELDPTNPLFAAAGNSALASERFDPLAENWLHAPIDLTSEALVSEMRRSLFKEHGVQILDFVKIASKLTAFHDTAPVSGKDATPVN